MNKKEMVFETHKEIQVNFNSYSLYKNINRLKGMMDLKKESIETIDEIVKWYNNGAEITNFKKRNAFNLGKRFELKEDVEIENQKEKVLIVFHEIKDKGMWCEESQLIMMILNKRA